MLRGAAVAGRTTRDLNDLAEQRIRGAGAVPSFLGYGHPPFSGTVCISVNDEVVHGLPGDRSSSMGTSCRSTAAPSSTAGTATRRSP